MSTLYGAGGLTGTHCPVPLEPRPVRQSTRPTGFDWGTPTPDPDAITRLAKAGVLTVTPEVVDGREVQVVRRRKTRPRTTVDWDAAAADYRSGLTTAECAAKHGCSQQHMSAKLRDMGVPMRKGRDARSRR